VRDGPLEYREDGDEEVYPRADAREDEAVAQSVVGYLTHHVWLAAEECIAKKSHYEGYPLSASQYSLSHEII